MRLFHFSDDPDIAMFEPRAPLVPALRPAGRAWLNEPLVWAIDQPHEPLYLFPRDCPRILVWPLPDTTPDDLDQWWGARTCRMIAHIEWAWFQRLATGVLHRYEFSNGGFEDLSDAGMWVSREAVTPSSMTTITDLPAALADAGAELRVMDTLAPLRDVWSTSLHASGIRLRNARLW